jgi:TonB-linked SusC/RagA family outer membrane protein
MRKILLMIGGLLLCLFANAQSSPVSGQVKDNLGNPIPYATIKIQNTNTAVAADSAGRFTIEAGTGVVLVISAAGFQDTNVTVGNSANIEVTMENPDALSEVVVTALGIRRNKNELPYAAQQVKGEELTKVRTTNFANALSGKVAGLQIKQNNTMGGSTNIILRGYKSITGENQALVVIDGVPANNANTNTANQQNGRGGFDYGNAAADINPDDVESVNVLKGAAATALYGSRAANGVILITTKKGRRGLGVTLNIGGGTGSMDKSTWVKYQHEYGGGYYDPDFYTYSDSPPSPNERFLYFDANGDGVKDLVIPTTEDASFGARFDPGLSVYQWSAFDPRLPSFQKATPYVAAANDPTSFFEDPMSSNISLFVDGGGERGTFKLGYTRSDDKGILPNSRISKDLINLQTSYNITSKLTVNATVNFSKVKGVGRYGSGYGDARSLSSHFRQWWQMNVDVKELENAWNLTKDNVTWNMSGPPDDLGPIYWDNPYYTRYESFSNDNRYRLFGIASLNYQVTDWLNILARASIDSYDQLQEERDGYASVNIGSYSRFNQTFREYNYDLIANFDKNLSDKLNLKALIGGNLRQNNVNSIFASTNGGLIIPGLYALSNSANPINAPTEVDQRVEVGGVFAGATVSYNQLLVLDLTARTDQSSTLPEGNNQYFYPSISGGFIFSKLLPNVTWLNQGKLRLNYAEVGSPAPWDYTTNSYDQPTPYGSVPLFSVSNQRRNPDLKPERTRSYEAGLELSLFKSRVGLDLTYYKTNTVDQIIPVTVSGSTGYSTRIINAGDVENRGWEVSLTLVPIRTTDFSWTINTNWTRTRNEVKSLIGGTQNIVIGSFQGGVTLNAAVGEPFGTLRGNDYVYDEKTGRPVVGDDGYYLVSQTTNNIIGNINPDWVGGINNILTYKDFSLSFLFDGRQGGSIYSIDQWYGQGTGLYQAQAGLNDLGNPVRNSLAEGGGLIFPGVLEDGTENTQRVLLTGLRGYGYNNFPNKSVVYDASFIKLREANLTWSIPARISDRLAPVKGIDVSLFGRNLWMVHKNLPDADPEDTGSSGNIQGFQVGSYPLYRTYGFNVRFKF